LHLDVVAKDGSVTMGRGTMRRWGIPNLFLVDIVKDGSGRKKAWTRKPMITDEAVVSEASVPPSSSAGVSRTSRIQSCT
jgi:hypothetical protein